LQRAFSVDSSQWFKRWRRRDHSGDPKVVFSADPDKDNSSVPDKGKDPDRGNSNVLARDNAPGRVNSNVLAKGKDPGEWTEVVAVRA